MDMSLFDGDAQFPLSYLLLPHFEGGKWEKLTKSDVKELHGGKS